jgi:hypothetical protein
LTPLLKSGLWDGDVSSPDIQKEAVKKLEYSGQLCVERQFIEFVNYYFE